jgi:hypothetical protein
MAQFDPQALTVSMGYDLRGIKKVHSQQWTGKLCQSGTVSSRSRSMSKDSLDGGIERQYGVLFSGCIPPFGILGGGYSASIYYIVYIRTPCDPISVKRGQEENVLSLMLGSKWNLRCQAL